MMKTIDIYQSNKSFILNVLTGTLIQQGSLPYDNKANSN